MLKLNSKAGAIRGMVDLGFKGIEIGERNARRKLAFRYNYSGSNRNSGGEGSSHSSGCSSAGGSYGGRFR